jgi:hypothetical protein
MKTIKSWKVNTNQFRNGGIGVPVEGQPIDFTKAFGRATNDTPPILTRSSLQTTKDVDTKGLEIGKTTLGDYRQGRAIAEGQIFPSIPFYPSQGEATYFPNIGNNTFQPENDSRATQALIERIGDQHFKAKESDEWESYFAENRLAREVEDAERTAGLSEIGASREILRNVVSHRRTTNENDFLRRAMDSGLSAEDAKDELEGLRRANALHEMKAEDRSYQAKLLITRLANGRGLNSIVQEPLTNTSAIMNPQPSQQMASAMGQPGTGFGDSHLDIARQFVTPEYYRRMLRKTTMTNEAADRQTAMNAAFLDEQIQDESNRSKHTGDHFVFDEARNPLLSEKTNVYNQALEEMPNIQDIKQLERYKIGLKVFKKEVDELRQKEEADQRANHASKLQSSTATGRTLATASAEQRENELESMRESVASKLSAVRLGKRFRNPLPNFVFAPNILEKLLGHHGKKDVRYSVEDFVTMTTPQLIIAINQLLILHPSMTNTVKDYIRTHRNKMSVKELLKKITEQFHSGSSIQMPYLDKFKHEIIDEAMMKQALDKFDDEMTQEQVNDASKRFIVLLNTEKNMESSDYTELERSTVMPKPPKTNPLFRSSQQVEHLFAEWAPQQPFRNQGQIHSSGGGGAGQSLAPTNYMETPQPGRTEGGSIVEGVDRTLARPGEYTSPRTALQSAFRNRSSVADAIPALRRMEEETRNRNIHRHNLGIATRMVDEAVSEAVSRMPRPPTVNRPRTPPPLAIPRPLKSANKQSWVNWAVATKGLTKEDAEARNLKELKKL